MEKNYLQTHGTAMGTKMAVAFTNIFMSKEESEIISQSALKPLESLETLYRRHILTLDYNQRKHNTVHWTSEQSPTHDQIYGWNFWHRNNIPGHQHL